MSGGPPGVADVGEVVEVFDDVPEVRPGVWRAPKAAPSPAAFTPPPFAAAALNGGRGS